MRSLVWDIFFRGVIILWGIIGGNRGYGGKRGEKGVISYNRGVFFLKKNWVCFSEDLDM